MGKNNFVLIITGPNAVGKGTLLNRLLDKEKNKDKNKDFQRVVRHTTRVMAKSETDGVTYHFVNETKFQELIKAGEFVEWIKYLPGLYGTTKQELIQPIQIGKNAAIELDVDAAKLVRQYLKLNNIPFKDIFVIPTTLQKFKKDNGIEKAVKEITKRTIARNRGFDLDPLEIEDRENYAKRWFTEANDFTYILENPADQLEKAFKTLKEIVE